jgi:hypothetical protein
MDSEVADNQLFTILSLMVAGSLAYNSPSTRLSALIAHTQGVVDEKWTLRWRRETAATLL